MTAVGGGAFSWRPRWRRRRSTRGVSSSVAGSVAATLVVAGLALFYLGTSVLVDSSPRIELCGGSLTDVAIRYSGPESGFLSFYYGVQPAICSVEKVAPFSDVGAALFLHNDDRGSAHVVTSLRIDAPFVLLAVAPPLPVAVLSGGNVSLELTLEAPGSSGDFTPAGALTVD